MDSSCGIPKASQAYVLNATVVPQEPLVSTLNAFDGAVTSNLAIVPAGNRGDVDAYANGLTDLILDISSYFAGGGSRRISVPSFRTNLTAPSGSTTFAAGQRSAGKLASIAFTY